MALSCKLQTRQSVLAKLLSIALFCSVFLQLVTVTKLSLQQNENLRLVAVPDDNIRAATESSAAQQQRPYLPVKKDYDKAAPKGVKDSGRCHFLTSISHRQTPRHLVTNQTAILEGRTTLYEEGLLLGANDFRPLYMYNPSLLPLTHMDPFLREEITGHDVDLKYSGRKAMYLALYRVSTFCNCFGPQGGGPPVHSRNYQGLALLDEHLDMVPNTDIVVDVSYWIRKLVWNKTPPDPKKWLVPFHANNNTYHLPHQHFTDCRLAIMPAPIYRGLGKRADPNDALYMTCDSRMLPIAVHRLTDDESDMPSEEELRRASPTARILPNEFGNGLRLSVLNGEGSLTYTGKNLNTFRVNATHFYLEYYPLSPHEAYPIHFIHRKDKFRPVHLNSPPIASTRDEPNATWQEPETFRLFSFRERDRGGGCCVEIIHQNRTLLVGISHTRTIERGHFFHHQYLSRLYAFEPSPPFNILSKTGLFCLGYGTSGESRGNIQVGVNEKLLQINKNGKTYQCPAISFVTSLSEHATNSSLAIISYGINDCYPRMVLVEKAELTRMLFPRDEY